MTPLRLTLNEFGPYTESQEIDFQALGEHQLFLIHGPTGSGKSTVLDAICFALYGQTSGEEREGDEMRSDFARLDEPTEVTFDFRLGDAIYRVERRPRMELAKKRGEGTTTKSEQATLYDQTDTDDRAEEGTPLADGKVDVDTKVKELLGLEGEQFRQVVVLPQGKFRAFLSADSSERENILKVLFDTDRFERLQEQLKAMAGEAKQEVQQIRQRQTTELERHEAENRSELAEKREALQDELDEAKKEKKSLQKNVEKARETLDQAKKDQKVLDELSKARETVDELRAEQEAQEQRASRLENARRAAEVAPRKDSLDERRTEKEEAQQALSDAKETLGEAEATLESSKEAYEAEQERKEEREALRSKKTALEELREPVATLADVIETLDEKEAKRDEAKEALETARNRQEELATAIEDLSETLEAKKEIASQEGLREKAFEEANTLKEKAQSLKNKRSAVQDAESTLESARETRDTKEKALEEATETLQSLEAKRRDAYASVLAQDLTDGAPCPVCGSTEHPDPAPHAEEVPGEDAIEAARDERSSAREALDEAQAAVADAKTNVATRQQEVESLLESHPELETKTEADLQQEFQEAQSELEEARQASEAAETIEQSIEDHEADLETVGETIEEHEETYREARSEVDRLSSRADTIRERVPDGIDSEDDLDAEIERVSATLDERENALETVREAYQDAREAHAEAKTTLDNASSNLESAAEALSAAKERFRDALREHGFEDASAFEAARMKADDRAALKEKVETFTEEWTKATDRKSRLEEKAQDIEDPDVDAAEEKKNDLEEALSEQREWVFEQKRTLEEIEASLEALGELAGDLEAAEAQYERIGHLAELARGKNNLKMSLQRFVLATRLEDVLEVANEHMAHMSQNRYRLRRDTDVQDYRRGAGLDLLVEDAFTGNERPVATLSGGEGFQAALALALGLSDVVQRQSGGRHLETIFIDEGFGSLDPEALDRAMESLAGLQSSGRLVGLISHVGELKQRVPARLEVHPTQEGSTLRMET
jgi:exonuclease SbcC